MYKLVKTDMQRDLFLKKRYSCFGLLVTSALGFTNLQTLGASLACALLHLCEMDSSDSPLVRHLLALGDDQHGG